MPTAVPVALEQSQKKEDAKVICAERIELVNNRGAALAVFDVVHSGLSPAGAPVLTMTSTAVPVPALNSGRRELKSVISTGSFSMRAGEQDSVSVAAGAVTIRNAEGDEMFGMIPTVGGGTENGIMLSSKRTGRLTTMNGASVIVSDRNGFTIAGIQ